METNYNSTIRLMKDGYTLLRPVDYCDEPLPYYLMKRKYGYKERVPFPTARKIIERHDVEYRKTTNWEIWEIMAPNPIG